MTNASVEQCVAAKLCCDVLSMRCLRSGAARQLPNSYSARYGIVTDAQTKMLTKSYILRQSDLDTFCMFCWLQLHDACRLVNTGLAKQQAVLEAVFQGHALVSCFVVLLETYTTGVGYDVDNMEADTYAVCRSIASSPVRVQQRFCPLAVPQPASCSLILLLLVLSCSEQGYGALDRLLFELPISTTA